MGDRREPPRDTGIYAAETEIDLNGVRVKLTGDEAAYLHMALLAGDVDAETLIQRLEALKGPLA